MVCGLAMPAFAQQASSNNAIPQLVNYSGVLTGINGEPLSGVAGVTFSLYAEESGGVPLWSEIQNVQMRKDGSYAVMLGSTSATGLPQDAFVSGEARWLGVQAEGQQEQPRVLLVAVPYALKAGDAQTIGGLPASAFVLANGSRATAGGAQPAMEAASSGASKNAPTASPLAGTQDYIPIWTDSVGGLGNSVLYQSGAGSTARIGVNTATPEATLDVKGSGAIRGTLSLPATGLATATAGNDSSPLSLTASVFNSSTSAAVAETFQLKAEPVGNDTATAAGALSLLYGSGTSAPAETGLQIAGTGVITFASGQTFPGAGAGTVTRVSTGAGLTGGPITTSGTLSIAPGGVSNAMLANPSLTVTAGGGLAGGGPVSLGGGTTLGLQACSANQVLEYIGGVWTCTTIGGGGTITGVTAGTDLTGGGPSGTVTLNVDTTKVPQLAAANTFTASQTINGNLSATGAVSASSFQGGGGVLAVGSYAAQNASLGFGGNTTMTGTSNTAGGYDALHANTTGSFNEASGEAALFSNTTGNSNTATGPQALFSNTTGNSNTATGPQALFSNTTGSYNAASGTSSLELNLTGGQNTASGYYALGTNTTGSDNTGIGYFAGSTVDGTHITGSYNTFLGYATSLSTGALTNATAIGANAQVNDSNSLVLGGIAGVNGATVNTFVGIGTTTPHAELDVAGNQLETYIGDPGCGAHPFAGIAFGSLGFQSCGNYSMVGDSVNTYIAAPTGDIYFRTQNNNVTAMTIDPYGDVNITGNLSKGGGSFKIDHPLDPANKYLYHSFVESPDMMNIYNGMIVLDANGEAVVGLPDWFEALNRDFRYQLTPVGAPGPNLHIAEEVANNQFKIAGGKPGSKVSWQVTGIRHDAYADAHRIPTEVEKPPKDQGHYLHPELFGAGPEQTVGYNGQSGSTRALLPGTEPAKGYEHEQTVFRNYPTPQPGDTECGPLHLRYCLHEWVCSNARARQF